MKRVLITGQNSYIGTSFKEWIDSKYSSSVQIESVSVRDDRWLNKDFSLYDTIIHLAAIVHKTDASKESYYNVNRDLTIKIAEKAKREGVKHFIFFSTLSVYGNSINKISHLTVPTPSNDYGKSKLEAEELLTTLVNRDFRLSIIRPPIVYGPNCPGNFSRLLKLSKKLFIFPVIENKKSMVYIEDLCKFLYLVMKYNINGLYVPQNKEWVSTTKLFREMREVQKKNILLFPIGNLDFLITKMPLLNKMFGNLVVEQKLSEIPFPYQSDDFRETIIKTLYKNNNNE